MYLGRLDNQYFIDHIDKLAIQEVRMMPNGHSAGLYCFVKSILTSHFAIKSVTSQKNVVTELFKNQNENRTTDLSKPEVELTNFTTL